MISKISPGFYRFIPTISIPSQIYTLTIRNLASNNTFLGFVGWSMDVMGLFEKAMIRVHKYILVVIDCFSKWAEAPRFHKLDCVSYTSLAFMRRSRQVQTSVSSAPCSNYTPNIASNRCNCYAILHQPTALSKHSIRPCA